MLFFIENSHPGLQSQISSTTFKFLTHSSGGVFLFIFNVNFLLYKNGLQLLDMNKSKNSFYIQVKRHLINNIVEILHALQCPENLLLLLLFTIIKKRVYVAKWIVHLFQSIQLQIWAPGSFSSRKEELSQV